MQTSYESKRNGEIDMFQEMMISAGGGGGNGLYKYVYASELSVDTPYKISLGFVPKRVVAFFKNDAPTIVAYDFDVENGVIYRSVNGNWEVDMTSSMASHMYVQGTDFYYVPSASSYVKDYVFMFI